MAKRECGKCKGSGAMRGPLGKTFKQPCDVCSGTGMVGLSNVVTAPIAMRVGNDADAELTAALGQLDNVVIVGYTKEGEEFYASNLIDGPSALWQLQRAAHNLLGIVDKELDV